MHELEKNISIDLCDSTLKNNLLGNGFVRADLTDFQRASVDAFASKLPNIVGDAQIAGAYRVRIPGGIAGELMKYESGGVGSPITVNGKIVGHADFIKMADSAAVMGVFTAMSIITSQYFLKKIYSTIAVINKKLNEIIALLYGEKKAELFAEISFVQKVYNNFSSIMEHHEQRIATIAGLQNSQKIAMKDIEFYINDIRSKAEGVYKHHEEFEEAANTAINDHQSLESAVQLLIVSSVLEAIFFGNSDQSYLDNLEEMLTECGNKCSKKMCTQFSRLNDKAKDHEKKLDRKIIDNIRKTVEKYDDKNDEKSPDMFKQAKFIIDDLKAPKEIIITSNKELYVKQQAV